MGAADARDMLLDAAATSLGIMADGLILSGSGAVKSNAGDILSYADIVKATGRPIRGYGHSKTSL